MPRRQAVEGRQRWRLHFYTRRQAVREGISAEAPARLEEAVDGVIMTAHGTGK